MNKAKFAVWATLLAACATSVDARLSAVEKGLEELRQHSELAKLPELKDDPEFSPTSCGHGVTLVSCVVRP